MADWTFASRLDQVEVSDVRKLFDMAPDDAVHLGLGEPDFNPAPNVIEALGQAARDGKNKYSSTVGMLELRQALANRLNQWDPNIEAGNIVTTIGGTQALNIIFHTIVNPGDEVLLPNPYFVIYPTHTKLAGGTPVLYDCPQETNFAPDVDQLEKLVTEKTRAILVNFPSNPTGGTLSEDQASAIAEFADRHDLYLITDEVYDEVVYEDPHVSFLGRAEKVIYTNSFSKSYAMTGWRLGYLAAAEPFVKEALKLLYFNVACPVQPIQYAALEAVTNTEDYRKTMVAAFHQRRDLIVDLLNDIPGITCLRPNGAFYAFPRFDHDIGAKDLTLKCLAGGLVCSPGVAFGPGGEGHLRFSYATSEDKIRKGIGRLRTILADIPRTA